MHEITRFKSEAYSEEHLILDTQSRLKGEIIQTDLYCKPADIQ